MTPVAEAFIKREVKAANDFNVTPEDGLFSIVAKRIFSRSCWRVIYRCVVPLLLKTWKK